MIENKHVNVKNFGSIEFQVLQLSKDIKNLTEHLKMFKKDYHSKYGLIKKVSKKKAFIKYLKKNKNFKLSDFEI